MDGGLLATANILIKDSFDQLKQVRALCDNGSQVNLITTDCVQRLRLAKKPLKLTLNGIGGPSSTTTKGKVTLTINSRIDKNFSANANFLIVKRITSNLPTSIINKAKWSHLNNLELADPEFHIPSPVDALLGVTFMSRIIKKNIVKGNESTPIAQSTIMGWIVFGQIANDLPNLSSYHMLQPQTTGEIEYLLRRFWEIHEPPPMATS